MLGIGPQRPSAAVVVEQNYRRGLRLICQCHAHESRPLSRLRCGKAAIGIRTNQRPDNTASIADTSTLACAAMLSTGRRRSLAGKGAATRDIVMQHKTQRPVQFEITQASRDALQAWIKQAGLKSEDFLFPSRLHDSPHPRTPQYARTRGHCVD
jgi:hypothetical protein